MRREDFIFVVGYDADTAIVDRKAKKRYGRLSTTQLADRGLYKAAFCSAIFSGQDDEVEYVLQAYNTGHGTTYASAAELMRLFGVDEVRADVSKTRAL